MFNSANLPGEFLASNEDLVSVLAHFADSSRRHSAQHRRDCEFADTALSALLPTISREGQLPPLPHAAAPDPPVFAPQRTSSGKAGSVSGHRHTVEVTEGVSRIRRRQYCQCGQCKWCLDNARWDRIFNEKFADPTYYGSVVVRHSSSLAELR
jgi:hypothetical protein